MATNANERVLNHQDGLDIVEKLEDIKTAIVALNNADGENSISKLAYQTKLGSAEKLVPLASQYKVDRTTAIVVTMDKIDITTKLVVEGNASCSLSVGDITKFNEVFGATGATAIQCYYDGHNWRDYSSDQIIIPTDEGATISGTPATGDRATLTRTASNFILEVADFDHYESSNPSIKHLTTLVSEDCVHAGLQFEPPQMSWGAAYKELPAGKYKFTALHNADDQDVADGVYVFTTTKAIPLGGGWRHSNIGKNFEWGGGSATMITDGTITTYASDRSTTIETGIAVSSYNESTDSNAIDLGVSSREYYQGQVYVTEYGVMNFSRRSAYGDGSYANSAFRQWLNSDKAKGYWWKAVGIFDLKPGYATTENGFLYGCDSDFVNNIQKSKVNYYMHDADYDLMNAQSASKPISFSNVEGVSISGRVITCEDVIFPLSVCEVGFGNQYQDNLAGNTALELYDGASNEDRIKYYADVAKYYWLRSSFPWSCGYTAYVKPSGALNYGGAPNTWAVALACNIG